VDTITLSSLKDFPRRLEAYYAEIPPDFKNWSPSSWKGIPSEPFSPIEQVCHVRDIEVDAYHVRFRRALQESNPRLVTLIDVSCRNRALTIVGGVPDALHR